MARIRINLTIVTILCFYNAAAWSEPGKCKLNKSPSKLNDSKGNLPEISGIDKSNVHDNVFWVHNDSGGQPEVYGITREGKIVSNIKIDAPADDWEDLATGSCSSAGDKCIYIGDMGNNSGSRDTFQVIVFQEPAVLEKKMNSKANVYNFRYPDFGRYNAESLAFNEANKTLYLIQKVKGDQTLYRFPRDLKNNMVLEPVCAFKGLSLITGADINEEGRRIIIRSGKEIREYEASSIDDPAICTNVIRADSYASEGYFEKQGEAIAYFDSDRQIISVSEGKKPKIFTFTCTD